METLYNKYRPRRFADVYQPVAARVLKAQIAQNQVAASNLLIGPPGTGKTTLARVAAMALLCERRKPGEEEPCGECESCRLIIADRHRDVTEVNCAVNGGKDEVLNAVISRLRLAPSGEYRIFTMDEAHMLTPQSQNALLKVVEEPPPYVRFFFSTTDVGKILPAIQSRCQIHTLRLVDDEAMLQILEKVVKAEEIPAEEDALDAIVQHAAGCAREALKALQAVAVVGVTEENVSALLGRAPRAMAIALARHIQSCSRGEARLLIEAAKSEGRDLESLIRETFRVFDRMVRMKVLRQPDRDPQIAALANQFGSGSHLLQVSDEIRETLKKIRQNVSPELDTQLGVQLTIDRFALLLAKSKAASASPSASS